MESMENLRNELTEVIEEMSKKEIGSEDHVKLVKEASDIMEMIRLNEDSEFNRELKNRQARIDKTRSEAQRKTDHEKNVASIVESVLKFLGVTTATAGGVGIAMMTLYSEECLATIVNSKAWMLISKVLPKTI